jgi:transcription initiation factor TFIIA large subunit
VTSTGEPVMFQYMPPGPSESSILPDSGLSLNANHGRPASFMQQPAPWMKPRVVEINVNETYEERDEEENGYTQLPNSTQDSIPAIPPVTKDFFTLSTGKRKHDEMASGYVSGKYIPQQDGAGDEELSLASSVVAISSHTASTQTT